MILTLIRYFTWTVVWCVLAAVLAMIGVAMGAAGFYLIVTSQ